MVKELDIKIKMISAVNETLDFKIKNPLASEEEVYTKLAKTLSREKDKDTNLAMIAAISKTYNVFEFSKNKKQKEIINKLMAELPSILNNIDKK
ncbi:MAG: hypothetical protein NT076_04250 [Candidatus Pacearchaeota archaeon]|nr:hypothetical protein [Candidatus Pacearchaeota archaeon]